MQLQKRESAGGGALSGLSLKVFGLLCMVADHIGEFLPGTPLWLRYIGRLSAPIFFFLMVEAFFHSRHVEKYLLRLLGCGVGMQFGNWLLVKLFHDDSGIPNNIFLGLAGCLLMVIFIDSFLRGKRRGISLVGVLLSMLFVLFTEAGFIGIAITLAFYFFHGTRGPLAAAYVVASLLASEVFLLQPASYYFQVNPQWMMVFAIVPLLLYNGKRGRNTPFVKYLFYVFYPLHIWVLYLIGQWM
ncbi:conjugal transfer protein TraX [Zongyangia hominis]|uniref:Conjugal transfer protein TraX n=1 Tax=Zongyangia hominis TaxID=2763677 RepID=A0A926IA31_9FIRM|nr:conjugal transfer protein TraX [Zongyangia hominis]MBC8569791.1 conjugal transfer protein TraX [Zongyangia hominis]